LVDYLSKAEFSFFRANLGDEHFIIFLYFAS